MNRSHRREFLRNSAYAGIGFWVVASHAPAQSRSPNEKLNIGIIGAGGRGAANAGGVARENIVALCDTNAQNLGQAAKRFPNARRYDDWRKLLEQKNVDAVVISTPDHHHALAGVAAMKLGKHVYCEKPLAHSVYEARKMRDTYNEKKVATQMGTQIHAGETYRRVVELIQSGAIGPVREVHVWCTRVGFAPGKTRPQDTPPCPPHLNWDLWLGQAPAVGYCPQRCHNRFRFWFEYAGGQMTDWGAHHMDIAQWGIGADDSGPVEIEGKAAFPSTPDGYNVATSFSARMRYANGVELVVEDDGRNGVMFEGESDHLFVNRGTIAGRPVDTLKDHPLVREQFKLYPYDNLARPERMGKLDSIINHMGNFFDCVRDRRRPISDVVTQHRSASVCHLANISMRLGRKLRWDPKREVFIDDDEANRWLSRPQRKPYEIRA